MRKPTKKNTEARKKVSNLEKRAKAKVRRLEAKGISDAKTLAGLRQVDKKDTRALNSYAKKLEKFVSRETRYERGDDGRAVRSYTKKQAADRELARLERNAKSKLRRLEQKGVNPRAVSPIQKIPADASRKEKLEYIAKLQKFNSRKTTYAPGFGYDKSKGSPQNVARLRKAEDAVRKKREKWLESKGGQKFAPGTQSDATVSDVIGYVKGYGIRTPYGVSTGKKIDVSNLGDKELKTLAEKLERMASSDYLESKAQRFIKDLRSSAQNKEMQAIVDRIEKMGAEKIIDIQSTTDFQAMYFSLIDTGAGAGHAKPRRARELESNAKYLDMVVSAFERK